VPDRGLAATIFGTIQDEYRRTCNAILAVTGHAALMDSDPVIQRSVQLRNPYVDPLNYLQVETLRRLRALPDPESAEAGDYREVIVLTINGIAAGLRNTDERAQGGVLDEVAEQQPPLGDRPVDDPRGVRGDVERRAIRAREGAHQRMDRALERLLFVRRELETEHLSRVGDGVLR